MSGVVVPGYPLAERDAWAKTAGFREIGYLSPDSRSSPEDNPGEAGLKQPLPKPTFFGTFSWSPGRCRERRRVITSELSDSSLGLHMIRSENPRKKSLKPQMRDQATKCSLG